MTKVVILAGGFGTRLSEMTSNIPKPMVPIGGLPMIHHIMSIYSNYGFDDFVIAAGYLSSSIKQYFIEYYHQSCDFTVNLSDGVVTNLYSAPTKNWRVTVVDTGLHTQTGGRVLKLREILENDTFMLTYGDGVSDLNIHNLLAFHARTGTIGTLTSVRPPARFGELTLSGDLVQMFQEKPRLDQGWINGGFFVFSPEIFDYIDGDVMLERQPLARLAKNNQLSAFKHDGFWQCADTLRDIKQLEGLVSSGKAPWLSND